MGEREVGDEVEDSGRFRLWSLQEQGRRITPPRCWCGLGEVKALVPAVV